MPLVMSYLVINSCIAGVYALFLILTTSDFSEKSPS